METVILYKVNGDKSDRHHTPVTNKFRAAQGLIQMREEEIQEIKQLLINLDQKLDRMMDKIDAKLNHMMDKVDQLMEKLGLETDIQDQDRPQPGNGCFLKDVDGKSQLFSWETKDFFTDSSDESQNEDDK